MDDGTENRRKKTMPLNQVHGPDRIECVLKAVFVYEGITATKKSSSL